MTRTPGTRTPGNRLVEARIAAGYESSREAADAFGWVYVTYNAHENGSRGIRASVAEKYADAYGVANEWILFGTGAGPRGKTGGPARRRSSHHDLPGGLDARVLKLLLEAAIPYLTRKKLNQKRLAIDIEQAASDVIGFTESAAAGDGDGERLTRFHQSVEQALANILRDHGVRQFDLLQAQHVASAASAFLAEAWVSDPAKEAPGRA